jgi:hypothetical protein
MPVAYIFLEPMFLLCCTSGRYGYLWEGVSKMGDGVKELCFSVSALFCWTFQANDLAF